MNSAEKIEEARFRAAAGQIQGLGATPREALDALLTRLPDVPSTPIIIWPFNQGDAFFTDAQQARSRELKSRRGALTAAEAAELESLVEASFDATVARTQTLQQVKT